VADHQAEVRRASLDGLQACVTAIEEHELDVSFELRGLARAETPVHLESDEIVVQPDRTPVTAKVVLARGQKRRARAHRRAPFEARGPALAGPRQLGHLDSTVQGRPRLDGLLQERLVEDPPGEADGRERQGRPNHVRAADEPHGRDRNGSKGRDVEPERREVTPGFVGEKFAADLVGRSGVAFDERHAGAGQCEPGRE